MISAVSWTLSPFSKAAFNSAAFATGVRPALTPGFCVTSGLIGSTGSCGGVLIGSDSDFADSSVVETDYDSADCILLGSSGSTRTEDWDSLGGADADSSARLT